MNNPPVRLPPNSVEMEAGVLGCVLLDPATGIGKCMEIFGAADSWLYDPRHQTIWSTLMALRDSNRPCDLVSIVAELAAKGALETIGGYEYLDSLQNKVPSSANLGYYLETCRELYQLRRLIATCSNVISDAYANPEDVGGLLDRASAEVLEVSRSLADRKYGILTADRVASAALEYAEQLRSRQDSASDIRVKTGIDSIDKLVAIEPGHFVILAGRQSSGKTSLALCILRNMANRGIPVGMMSLETSSRAIGLRWVQAETEISRGEISNVAGMDPFTFERLGSGLTKLSKAPFYLYDRSGLNIRAVRERAREMVRLYKIRVLAIDYLQLIRPPEQSRLSSEQHISAVSSELKTLAKELDITVIALSQLNRENAKDGEQTRPRLAMMRGSGMLENDADIVMLLWHHAEPDDPADYDVKICVDKQKDGPTGEKTLRFRKRFFLFDEPLMTTQQGK